ncbi:MAG: xanthine dehydrogenase family protein molybdopterin-binding subunit [Deltaproteobacteria bacterium]|nr:MAG: xanthine dehydrogenase family protein molybdopterin-binding subunit [Deltaproteobacteria bacterium]
MPIERIDARAKLTGTAIYAAETPVANVAHAVIVGSTAARGRLRSVDTDAARRQPGVLAVLAPGAVPKLPAAPTSGTGNPADRVLQLLQDDKIWYADQPIAVVVADTLERAQHAAALVTAAYDSTPPVAEIDAALGEAYTPEKLAPFGEPATTRGDFDAGLAAAHARITATYTTPVENHNPMEPHATIAVWHGDTKLTLYDATQGIFGVRNKIAKVFGLEPTDVRVIDHYVGGGFGCKGTPWSHVALAALAARAVGRPVKLVVTRPQMFALVGHRPKTVQTLTLGADAAGKLTAIRHTVVSETSRFDQFVEPSALQTRHLYSCPNVITTHQLVKLDIPTPTFQRAPGESTGTYALESAMDELAYALRIDPLELRIRNHSVRDEQDDKPYSSNALLACYQRGAARFGWSRRTASPGSMRDRGTRIGWGMATATYPARMSPSSAIARMRPDGILLVQAGTQDIGTGTYTIMTQIAADAMGIPIEQVRFELGDTAFPETPVSGGSQTAASTGTAVKLAVDKLRDQLIALRQSPDEPWAHVVARSGRPELTAEHKTDKRPDTHSYHSHGATFAEVRIDPDTGEIRVARVVAVYAAGTILNPRTALSQLEGGIVWGIGMALQEHTVRDRRTGRAVTRDLADYHIPVHADIPELDVSFVEEPDPFVNPLGIKGIGELGITGVTAAIANAVYHATGKRVRDLPITLDKLL